MTCAFIHVIDVKILIFFFLSFYLTHLINMSYGETAGANAAHSILLMYTHDFISSCNQCPLLISFNQEYES